MIIPTHNRIIELERCLDSLTLQSFKNFEVIIVDDGSKDNISALSKNFENVLNIRYFRLDNASGGAARPRNKGISEAQAEWIAFLDSDDWWYPQKLERIKECLQLGDVIYHDLDLNEQGKKHFYKTVSARALTAPVFLDLMINHNGLVTSGVAVKKDFLQKVNGFREIELEDYDLWLRLSQITNRFYHIQEKLGCYWVGITNTTQSNKREIKRVERIYNLHKNEIPALYLKEALSAKRYIQGRIWDKMGKKTLSSNAYLFAFFFGSKQIKQKSFLHLFKNFIFK